MIKLLLIVFCVLQVVPAWAQQTYSKDYYLFNYPDAANGESVMRYAISQAAEGCTAALAYVDNYGKYSTSYTHYTNQPSPNQKDIFCYGIRKPDTTSKGWLAGLFRTCAEAYFDPFTRKCTNTVPTPPSKCSAGTRVTVTYETGTFSPPDNYTIDPTKVPNRNMASDGVCRFAIDEVVGCSGRANGKSYCTYSGVRTGDELKPGPGVADPSTGTGSSPSSTDTPVPSPPLPGQTGGGCPKGTTQAGIGPDGVPMCVGTGTSPTPSNTSAAPPKQTSTATSTNADGSTTTTTTTTTTNRDGSTTTVKDMVTTPPAGSGGATTTTQTRETSANSSGSPGKETKPEEVNFCKQNPNLSVCRESSVSGTCGQIACMGDAIQCATLRAAAAMECKLRADEEALKASPLHSLGAAASNGNDPMAGSLPTVKNATTVAVPTMAASGWIGGGSAFRDVSFTVQGRTFTLPLEKWTGYLVGLRYALMVVAMLVSFRMLSGVILRD